MENNKIVEVMEKGMEEFDKYFTFEMPNFGNSTGEQKLSIKSFLHSFALSLLKAVVEEGEGMKQELPKRSVHEEDSDYKMEAFWEYEQIRGYNLGIYDCLAPVLKAINEGKEIK